MLLTSTAHEQPLTALRRRLEQVLKRYSRGEVPRIDWLDPLTFTALDRLRLEVLVRLLCMRKHRNGHGPMFAQPCLSSGQHLFRGTLRDVCTHDKYASLAV